MEKDKDINLNVDQAKELYNKARNKSCTHRNSDIALVDYHGERYKVSVPKVKKVLFTVIAIIMLMSATLGYAISSGVNGLGDEIDKANVVSSALSDYRWIVSSETHRTQDNQGYWYDTYDIAQKVLESEDTDLALYAVYDNIGYNYANKIKHMDLVLQDMKDIATANPEKYSGISCYSNFDSFLTGMGCVDGDGKPSTEVYEDKMDAYAYAIGLKQKSEEAINKSALGKK